MLKYNEKLYTLRKDTEVNDKEMLEKSEKITTDEMLGAQDAPQSGELSNNTDSQFNIEAPAEAKKPRKRTVKAKSEESSSPEDEKPSEAKKPRKRTAKPKTEEISESGVTTASPTEITQGGSDEAKPKKRTAKNSSSGTAESIIAVESVEINTEAKPLSPDMHEADAVEIAEEATEDSVHQLFSASTYITDDAEHDQNSLLGSSEVEETDETEEIIPPDELFAKRDTAASVAEDIAEGGCKDESAEDDAPVDGDGQYIIPELEEYGESLTEKYAEEAPPEKYDPRKPRKIDGRFDLIELFVFTLLAVMIITSFFFRHSVVQGDSMQNTLQDEEHLIISDFFYTPERGDVVVCEDHTAILNSPIVKRVIAVGGDHVKITRTAVFVNGKMLEEDYVYIDPFAIPYYYEPLELTVPKGEIFVMGDHRNNSTDSRDLIRLGTISEDAVLGKVLLRFYPFDKFGTVQ